MAVRRVSHQHYTILFLLMYSREDWLTRTASLDGGWHLTFSLRHLSIRLRGVGAGSVARMREQMDRLVEMGAVSIVRREGYSIQVRLNPLVANAPQAPWAGIPGGPRPEVPLADQDRRVGAPRDRRGHSGEGGA